MDEVSRIVGAEQWLEKYGRVQGGQVALLLDSIVGVSDTVMQKVVEYIMY